MSTKTEGRVEMKRFLQLAGISSTDLHNWVNRGMLPSACGRYNGSGPGSTYYYPAWAVNRAADIKRLRLQGYPMQLIRKILAREKVGL